MDGVFGSPVPWHPISQIMVVNCRPKATIIPSLCKKPPLTHRRGGFRLLSSSPRIRASAARRNFFKKFFASSTFRNFSCYVLIVMKIADDGAAYTQKDIYVLDGSTGEVVALRPWFGETNFRDAADTDDVISFGDFGYYGAWEIV